MERDPTPRPDTTSGPSEPPVPLRDALRLEPKGDGLLEAVITEGWDVRGIPHGGYLLALAAEAMAGVVAQPDPLAISATYLAPPAFGPAELRVEPIRVGKRQSTASVRLTQLGVDRVVATATFGHLPDSEPTFPAGPLPPPDLPGPDGCLPHEVVGDAEGGPIRLHRNLDLRLAPDTGWVTGEPNGTGEIKGWLRLPDGSPVDPSALLVFSDGMPPSLFEAMGRIGHVPTMQLTTHLFARPAPGWILGRFWTRIVNGSFVGEDGDLWDQTGRLVATTRQMALMVPPRPGGTITGSGR